VTFWYCVKIRGVMAESNERAVVFPLLFVLLIFGAVTLVDRGIVHSNFLQRVVEYVKALADNSLSTKASFIWGAGGAIFPKIIRLNTIATNQQNYPYLKWPYFVISLLFMFCSGALSIAWKPENAFKPIWVGISFPTLISTLARTAPNNP
jgi:hypothetical protein